MYISLLKQKIIFALFNKFVICVTSAYPCLLGLLQGLSFWTSRSFPRRLSSNFFRLLTSKKGRTRTSLIFFRPDSLYANKIARSALRKNSGWSIIVLWPAFGIRISCLRGASIPAKYSCAIGYGVCQSWSLTNSTSGLRNAGPAPPDQSH